MYVSGYYLLILVLCDYVCMLFLFLCSWLALLLHTPVNHRADMPGNDQGDNQSECSFINCGSEVSVKLEDNNMDVDKLTVVSDAPSDSKEMIIVQAAAKLQVGIADGVGVPASPDVPIPPPGD